MPASLAYASNKWELIRAHDWYQLKERITTPQVRARYRDGRRHGEPACVLLMPYTFIASRQPAFAHLLSPRHSQQANFIWIIIFTPRGVFTPLLIHGYWSEQC